MDYSPYGKILREYIKTPEKYVTTGHERDAETGLDYRGARFYDADVARFLSLDPLAAEFPAWSDYNYVLGNPVMFTDPDGRTPIISGAVGAAIGGVVGFGVGFFTGKGTTKDKLKSGLKGFIGGAITGAVVGSGLGLVAGAGMTGFSTTTLAYGGIFGGIGSGISSIAVQQTEVLMGDRTSISSSEVATDILIGIPAGLTGTAGNSVIKAASKNWLKRKIGEIGIRSTRRKAQRSFLKEAKNQLKGAETLTKNQKKESLNILKETIKNSKTEELSRVKIRFDGAGAATVQTVIQTPKKEIDEKLE